MDGWVSGLVLVERGEEDGGGGPFAFVGFGHGGWWGRWELRLRRSVMVVVVVVGMWLLMMLLWLWLSWSRIHKRSGWMYKVRYSPR